MSIYYDGRLPTRTDETEITYLKNFERLRKKFMAELQTDDMSPDEVTAHLIINKDSYSMNTWRVYKNSVLFVLEKFFPQCHVAIDILLNESSKGLSKKSKRTSGQKSKGVPHEYWLLFQNKIQRRIQKKHKHSQGLLNVLTATLLTGLRPNEWCNAVISTYNDTDRKILRVKNSKFTNGRANGINREFFIDDLTANEISTIEAAIVYCQSQSKQEAKRIQLAIKNEFTNVKNVGAINPKDKFTRVSLYSFRHQFIADAKLTFNDPVVVAALAGHNSTKTAFLHYGRRKQGYSKIRIYPTPETILAVKNISPQVNTRRSTFSLHGSAEPTY